MRPRLSLRDGSWKIRSSRFTGSNETGRGRVNRSPTSNAWFRSGNVTNTSLKTDHLVDQIQNRCRALMLTPNWGLRQKQSACLVRIKRGEFEREVAAIMAQATGIFAVPVTLHLGTCHQPHPKRAKNEIKSIVFDAGPLLAQAGMAVAADQAQEITRKHGGRTLAVGGIGGNPTQTHLITSFSGEPPKRVTIQGWDSLDKVKAWQNDPEYVQLRRDVGEKHAKFRSYAVETQ